VTTPYNATTGVIGLAAPTGTLIRAGTSGTVAAVLGDRVRIDTSGYTVTYVNVRNFRVQSGQTVTADTVIAESVGPDSIQLLVQQAIDPTGMLVQPVGAVEQPATPPTKPAPTPPPTVPSSVVPTMDGVRLREKPVDGKPIGQVGTAQVLVSLEPAADTQRKLGVSGQWLQIRTPDGLVGYVACQFLAAYTGPAVPPVGSPAPTPATNILGMNLDMYNRLGRPSPDRLKGIGWIRVKFNVSFNPDNNTYGNTDINATYNRVKPFIEPYAKAGIKVLMVFTHQLFGEGAGYHWPSMDTGRWNDLIPKYADFAKRAAQLFVGSGLVHAYQIWNEQDTPPAVARAAVPIPASDYANMLTQTIRAIRTVDKQTPIITGGHVRGPGPGSDYARATLAAMPGDVRPDGIACHPYGRGVAGHMFSPFGALAEEIRTYSSVMPGKPVWITEWGVLDRQGDMSVVNSVTDYAAGFVNIAKSQFPTQVAAAIWYAWADGMDNGYGLVDGGDRPKAPLYDRFLKL
jgi:hypothetical protein